MPKNFQINKYSDIGWIRAYTRVEVGMGPRYEKYIFSR